MQREGHSILIGAIADDFTGATDLGSTLTRAGLDTIQTIGVPSASFDPDGAEAVVVALKSRTAPASEAVAQSVAAARSLTETGARQLFFKYCSTFDSTDQGNIGPVAEALLDHLKADLTVVCPSFPANGRTVHRGHLFVGDAPLSESPMKDHPLTPMRDANLVRVLQRQTQLPVGLIGHQAVRGGPAALGDALRAASGHYRMVVVDAATEEDLLVIGEAVADLRLVTGGSAVATGLPENFRRRGLVPNGPRRPCVDVPAGPAVILAGSCSAATRRQVAHAVAAGIPALPVDPLRLAEGSLTAAGIADWVTAAGHPSPLVHAGGDPADVERAQRALGRQQAGVLVETLLAEVAVLLRDRGYRRFLVAGGETSGAIVGRLGIAALRFGREIDPGVPWTVSVGGTDRLAFALKSGNFGADDFFLKAWDAR